MRQWTCHWSLLLTPLTLMSTVGESYAVIYSKMYPTISGHVPSVGTWDIPLTKIKTADYRNMLTESADKKQICWWEKSADRICWQKLNPLLTTKKPCRLETSKPLLKTLHHARQAMAGAHIPLVKFKRLYMCLGRTFLVDELSAWSEVVVTQC